MIPNSYPTLNFNLGETAEMLRAQVAAFAADEIAPIADTGSATMKRQESITMVMVTVPPWVTTVMSP